MSHRIRSYAIPAIFLVSQAMHVLDVVSDQHPKI